MKTKEFRNINSFSEIPSSTCISSFSRNHKLKPLIKPPQNGMTSNSLTRAAHPLEPKFNKSFNKKFYFQLIATFS